MTTQHNFAIPEEPAGEGLAANSEKMRGLNCQAMHEETQRFINPELIL